MKKMLLPLLLVTVLACRDGFHAPKEEEIRSAVKEMYESRNRADGGGGWVVNDVKIISVAKAGDERHYTASVFVNGVHTSAPLANRLPDQPVSEKASVDLAWRNGGWIWDEKE